MTLKKCRGCGEVKDVDTDFYRVVEHSGKVIIKSRCKKCYGKNPKPGSRASKATILEPGERRICKVCGVPKCGGSFRIFTKTYARKDGSHRSIKYQPAICRKCENQKTIQRHREAMKALREKRQRELEEQRSKTNGS